jgi:hypothetical protein
MTESGHPLRLTPGIQGIQIQRGEKLQTVVNVGSGEYIFVSPIHRRCKKAAQQMSPMEKTFHAT